MAEYIKREDAIDLFWPVDPENDGSDGCTVVLKCGHYNSDEIEAMLSDLPAADVVEVRHGRWEYAPYNGVYDAKCSNCGYSPGIKFWESPYCPNCGADMRGENNG